MDTWKQLFNDGVMRKGALSRTQYPDAATLFYRGDAAMIMQGNWEVGNLVAAGGRDILKSAYGVTRYPIWRPFPFPDVNGDGQPATVTSGDGDPGQRYLAGQLLLPDVKGYRLDVSRVADPSLKDVPAQSQAALASARYPREFNYPEIQEALGQALQNVASGQQDPQAALASVQQASDAIRR